MKIFHFALEYFNIQQKTWSNKNGLHIRLISTKHKNANQSSLCIHFEDGSGEIRRFDEQSVPYVKEDLQLLDKGSNILLAGGATIVPVVGGIAAGVLLGKTGFDIINDVIFRDWRNTQIFLFNSVQECEFALEIHFEKEYQFRVDEIFEELNETILGYQTES